MKTQSSTKAERANGHSPIWVFTPSRTDPKDLEFILVQRKALLQDAVERVRESAVTDHKHHLLFVGPRGCGKTHFVTLLVNRLSRESELADRLRIAWLNEDETCTTLLEVLFKIHAALEKRYPGEYQAEMLAAGYDMKQPAALEFISRHLLAVLGSRTLLVVVENLDALFEGLGDIGQKQLRSFIQENPKLSIVATAQRLVEDLFSRNSPFFGFFQTEHLKPLSVEQATELLQKIARLQGRGGVVEFLSTGRGRARVRAIHHLSGGNHRIYIVLSQFITRDSVDALLEPFMKMVDELTPYYQERIRWLPPLQRKIVEFLCICEGTVPVKLIAKRLFATPSTISSQLQDLREKGYVQANQRGRESLYEISENLLRICVEVKDNQRSQPLRLLVDFLRVWYEEDEHRGRLNCASKGQKQETLNDLKAVLQLPEVPMAVVVGAHLALAEHYFSEGQWAVGFQSVEASLDFGANTQPAQMADATDLVSVLFLAGLSIADRRERVFQLLRTYEGHQALPVLGEAVVHHIGNVFRAGAPFPSIDNLEGWAAAWEGASKSAPDFRLSARLLRTGIDFVKAGGQDSGVLLSLTSPERAILERAFGLDGSRLPRRKPENGPETGLSPT